MRDTNVDSRIDQHLKWRRILLILSLAGLAMAGISIAVAAIEETSNGINSWLNFPTMGLLGGLLLSAASVFVMGLPTSCPFAVQELRMN